ncbi:MAG TPA: ABC transporter substrate-binding protein [Vicinamibacterales bacterium]
MAPQLRQLLLGVTILLALSCGRRATTEKTSEQGPSRGGVLIASIRSEPQTFNRFAPNGGSTPTDVLTRLTQAPLVRINRVTGEPEPWLADHWTTSPDGRVLTVALRNGITFSDGVPLTSADVAFTFRALYDPAVDSVLASAVTIQGRPLEVSAPDAHTVVFRLPAPFTNAVGLLDSVWIYPQHQLQSALDAHNFARAWGLSTPPRSMAGLGPFVLSEFAPGQRMTFIRNPHYWRKDASGVALPYLDRFVIEIVKAQDAEILRMQAGTIDLMTQADLRPSDLSSFRKLRDQGALQLVEPGIGVDPDVLWFNLTEASRKRDEATKPYLHRAEFRQAISYAVNRDDIVNTLYLGAAVRVYGPVTPGNRTWYSDAAPKYPHDVARAKTLLAGLGLSDRDGNGTLEDASGRPVRFSIIAQAGHMRERVATMIQEQLKQVGIGVDVVALDPGAIFDRFAKGDYESIYYGFAASAFDPSLNLDFWLSSGSSHFWNPEQKTPATPWERSIDELMQKLTAAPTPAERQRLFGEVQRIFGENLPEIAFVAPRITIALSQHVGGAAPVLLDPKVLWQADTLYAR